MTSPALETWRSDRLDRLDRMLAAHPDQAGSAIDPVLAQEWTDALVLRLAAEFQGFCRDLHDDAVEVVMEAVSVPSEEMHAALADCLVIGRGLDRRSADPATIGADFARFGSDLWVALAASRPGSATAWREGLMWLHRARNGVAHDDRGALAAVQVAGWSLQFQSARRCRILLDEIATAMDDEISKVIAQWIGIIPKEWEVGHGQ